LRTPQQVRLNALIAYGLSLGAGVVVAFLVHLIFGSAGNLSFTSLNPGGVIEFLAFTLTFSSSLLGTREIFRLPITTSLTAGLIAPTDASGVAEPLDVLENPSTFELGTRTFVLRQNGRPVGLHDGDRDRTLPWDEVPRVSGSIAVTELRSTLSHAPFVVVADGDQVHGLITQEMFVAGLAPI
jgi:hypothetical protein